MGPISTLPSVTSWTLSGRVHPVAHWAPPLSQSQCLRGLLQADMPWPECRPPHTRAGPGGNRLRGLVAGPGGKVRAGRGAGKSRDRCCPLAGSNPLMLGGQREDPNGARQHQGPPGRASSRRRTVVAARIPNQPCLDSSPGSTTSWLHDLGQVI